MVVINTLYLNVSAFYPLFVEENYSENVNPTMVSIVLCSFELSGVLFTPINATTISKMGRKNAILIGLIIICLSTISLGLIAFIDNEHWALFFVLSVISRFV